MFLLAFTLFASAFFGFESATGSDRAYRTICALAAEDDEYFQRFRSIDAYYYAVEVGPNAAFASYLLEYGYKSTLERLDVCRELDRIGSPVVSEFPKVGVFSGTALRYVIVADQVAGLFSLPAEPRVAEIGAGFGGQCYILSQIIPFARYWIYDLPETERLIEKVVSTLSIPNVECLPVEAPFPEERIDLLISNYAFSECDREMQMDYFDRVVKRADRGYMIYNRTGGIGAMTPEEFFELLQKNGMKPAILPEPVCTYEGNVLIAWDRT